MRVLKYTFIGLILSLILSGNLFAKEARQNDPEATDTVADVDVSWYAILRVDGSKKLYTEGDIFYSDNNITKCLRIQEVKRDILILKDVNSNITYRMKPGDELPLERTVTVFEKAVDADVVKHRVQ